MNQENKELSIKQLKKQVLETAIMAYNEKMIAGTSGNVSAFYKKDKLMVITPSSYAYSLMEEKDIIVIDLEGNIIEGEHNPSSEWKMHAEIYKHLPEVTAIVHTHSPAATSFSVVRKEIPVILVEMIPFLKGSIEVSDFAAQGSAEVGFNAVPILKNKNACLMANHGVVAVGDTLANAYLHSVYVEDAAKIYQMALTIGEPVVLEV